MSLESVSLISGFPALSILSLDSLIYISTVCEKILIVLAKDIL